MQIIFTLNGVVPSKKNAWRRGGNGNVYLPAGVQADIDALIWQAKSARLKIDLTPIAGERVRVSAHFTVPREHKDLDNVFTTILDVLQTAGILENDKLVRAFSVDETVSAGPQSVEIGIEPLDPVCDDCGGTGEVSTDEEDGEGHTMKGVGTRKCHCGAKRPRLSTPTSRNEKQGGGTMGRNKKL